MAKRASLLSASKPQISRQVLTLAQVSMDSTGEMQMLPIDMIDPSPYQPREACNEKALDDLAASIKDVGIIQPVVVRPKDDKRYELVAGHRRWLAASHLAMNTIPAIIRPLDNKDAAALSLIENLQREDLNPIETAQGLQRMIDEFAATQKDLAALIGRSKADITHTLGLLKLLPDVQSYIKRGDLSAGHGRVLYRLPHRQQQALAKKAFDKGWTVRKLEQVIAEQKANHASEVPRNPDITRLENVLAEYFSIPVKIRSDQKGSGCITLRYNTLAECEAILERIGLSPDQYQ
ncbi:MAG: ParB/RepB/Spo0J family partition protein [Candidatus Competibacteraceae bacterium]|nr:ParB/RepB/Spo0J family partition protein [Candidatus Competibacter sp.]